MPLMECRICGQANVPQHTGLLQIGLHPAQGHIWPQCAACKERIGQHVAGIRAAAALKREADAHLIAEGW